MQENQSTDLEAELEELLVDDLVDTAEQSEPTAGTTTNLTPGAVVNSDRRDQVAQAEVDRLGDVLGIPGSTRETAKSLFNQYCEQADITGNALEVLAAACLYVACKVESVPLSPDDFAAVQDTAFTRVVLLRRTKTIASTLGLDAKAFFDPSQYIDRYCEELGVAESVQERAHEIIGVREEAGAGGGKSPTGRAAAAVYNACLDAGSSAKVTQSDIASVAGVSEVTIRNLYQEQRELIERREGGEPDKPVDAGINVEGQLSDEAVTLIMTVLDRLDTSKSLHSQVQELLRTKVNEPLVWRTDAEDTTLALAIIRRASEDIDEPISYVTLKQAVDKNPSAIHRVVADIDEWLDAK